MPLDSAALRYPQIKRWNERTWNFSRTPKLFCPQNNEGLTVLMVEFTTQPEAVLMHATKHMQKWKPYSTQSPMHAPDGGEQSASCPGQLTRGREHLVLPEQDRRVAIHCAVSTVTRIQVDDPGFESQKKQEISLFSKMSKWFWGPAERGGSVKWKDRGRSLNVIFSTGKE
jgi:hypothetical protein